MNTTALLRTLEATMAGRVESTMAALVAAVRERGYWCSADGRVSEQDAAALLGLSPGTLTNKRRAGTAPPCYRIGGDGHRITYRLQEMAEWIESRRET